MYQFAEFQFDSDRGVLIQQGREQHVRHKVALLIDYLIRHRERVISKEELLAELWEHGDYRENSLTQSVREARRLLGDSAQQPRFIRNYPQRGYQWVMPLDEEERVPMPAASPAGADDLPSDEPSRVVRQVEAKRQ